MAVYLSVTQPEGGKATGSNCFAPGSGHFCAGLLTHPQCWGSWGVGPAPIPQAPVQLSLKLYNDMKRQTDKGWNVRHEAPHKAAWLRKQGMNKGGKQKTFSV